MAHIGPHISRHRGADVVRRDNVASRADAVTDEVAVLGQRRRRL